MTNYFEQENLKESSLAKSNISNELLLCFLIKSSVIAPLSGIKLSLIIVTGILTSAASVSLSSAVSLQIRMIANDSL